MFKFGRKDKSKSDEKKKDRKDSKKDKKNKDSPTLLEEDGDNPRYTSLNYPPPTAPKPKGSHSSSLNVNLKNGGKPASSRGILKIRSSTKSKLAEQQQQAANVDDAQVLRENTRINEEFAWRTSPYSKGPQSDLKKRESIHSITMNIAPPSVPPPASATEKVYSVSLELPMVAPPPLTQTRDLIITRQPKGDFGFNLRWAPYKDSVSGITRQAVYAEPGSSGTKSGIIAGDRIIEINGKNVEHSTREQVIGLIQKSSEPLQLIVQQIPEVSELNHRSLPAVNGVQHTEQENGEVSPLVNGHAKEKVDRFWLIHRGGYSSCELIQPASSDGRCKVKLEQGLHILEVDENDLEKVNPVTSDRCENLSSLAYLNESSILHVLRQRYGSSLIHTLTGPSLLVINPNSALNIYSHKVMQMVRACKPIELPPHVYSKAQSVYQTMLTTSRDQSIVLTGQSGSGKTATMKHILCYYSHTYGGIHSNSIDEKMSAASLILESLGNCSTKLNPNATRFAHQVTLDFDHRGHIASICFQASMLEKSRIVKVGHGESPFHIFNYVMYGTELNVKQELQLQSSKNGHDVDTEAAVNGWLKLDQALRVLAITPDESKFIQQVVAAIIHLRTAGVQKGSNNKAYFAEPGSAQIAAQLLGVSIEELSKAIFSTPSFSSSKSSLRTGVEDELTASTEALDGFIIGLYTELFSTVLSLMNRSLTAVTRNATSIAILDTPGFKANSSEPQNFDDLCYNYVNERIQLLFHEKVFTENRERYIQESVEVDSDDITNAPDAMVQLLDKCSNHQLLASVGNSRGDLSLLGRDDDSDMGLLWLIDQVAITPGATEQQFIEKLYQTHGKAFDQCEKLVTLHPQVPGLLTLNHFQGTSPVSYDTAGWIKACRNHASAEQATNLLTSSQRSGMADMFGSMTGSMIGSFTNSSSQREGTLRRGNSVRRLLANQAGIKRRSQAILFKYQTDSLMEMLSKTGVHFVSHLVPSAGSPSKGELVLDVPFIRAQIRGMQLLPAIRFHRQGYPEHMTFGDFISRYSLLAGKRAQHAAVPLMDQKSVVEEMLATVDVDKNHYRIGLSQIFLRPPALAHLDNQRELRRSFYAVAIQKHIRRYLAQKAISKLKLKHEAMTCVQKNIRIHFKLRDWQWWKLYTKIKPLVNVQKTEEDLKVKETELLELRNRLEKVEGERTAYKKECARLEDEAGRFQAEYVQEKLLSRQAVELLEQETSVRLSMESQLTVAQSEYEVSRQKIVVLEKVKDQLRQVHQDYEDTHSDVVDASTISHHKYEHMVKEHELKRRQLQSEYEQEMELLQAAKHKIERQMHELMIEKDDQTHQIHNLKKKVQKYSDEAQDLKRQYENSEVRNSELEKKQRRFDNELHLQAGDIAGQRTMKDHLQKERDELLKQKYALSQKLEDVTIERDALQAKLRRLENDMADLKSSGTHGDSELMQLRTAKHDLERRLAESEDEIGDIQQEMHELEMAKLKLQIEVDKIKQRHQKEMDQLERELDELRDTTARKSRNYESRIAELDDELHDALQGRREAERKLLESRDSAPVRDHEHEKKLKTVIKRLRALLTDAHSQLEKSKEQSNQKSHIRTLETKLEDVQSSLTAALKSKHSLDIELQECQQQMSLASKSKMEAEDRVAKLMRDKTDVENEKEDLDEEIHELLKRYQSLVSSNTVTAVTLRDQSERITSLTETKNRLQEELDSANSRLAHLDSIYVPKDRIVVLESKCMEIEQKLDYEKSLRVRFENQSIKAKDNCERLEDEISKLTSKVADEERRARQLQSQLTRALESQETVNRKDIEQAQTISSLNQKIEIYEAETHSLQVELKSAQKRADHLQSTLVQSTMSDDETDPFKAAARDEEFSSDSEDGYS